MKILLTGSEGYIATNFKFLFPDYDIIESDILIGKDVLDIESLVLDVDCIVHLAAISGIKQCEENYEKTIRNNILTTSHLLKFGIPIVFASSQAAKNSNNTYALTKRISEMMIKVSDIPYTILRFANVYGGKNYFEKKTSVVSKFINAAKNHESILIHGNGKQTRDFIHVFDICNAINLAINNPIDDIVDIGTGIKTSVYELAYMISDNVKFLLGHDGGVGGNVADVKKAKELLGFDPWIRLENYIKGAINEDQKGVCK